MPRYPPYIHHKLTTIREPPLGAAEEAESAFLKVAFTDNIYISPPDAGRIRVAREARAQFAAPRESISPCSAYGFGTAPPGCVSVALWMARMFKPAVPSGSNAPGCGTMRFNEVGRVDDGGPAVFSGRCDDWAGCPVPRCSGERCSDGG